MKSRFLRSLRIFSAVIALVGLLAVPSTGQAATLQTSLDNALKQLLSRQNLRMDGEVTMERLERALGVSKDASVAETKLFFSQSSLAGTATTSQSQGTFVIKSFRDQDIQFSFTTPDIVQFEWKKVDGSAYIRLAKVPPEILNFLTPLMEQSSQTLPDFIGRWYRLPSSDLDSVKAFTMPAAFLAEESTLAEKLGFGDFDQMRLKTQSLLQVIRLEKRETRADGHVLARVRIRLNPRVITMLQQEELKQISAKDSQRVAKRQAINKEYAEIRTMLAGLSAVAVIDETAGTLERLEVGFKKSEPKKECAWNDRLKRDVCKTTGRSTAALAMGFSFFSEPPKPVAAPVNFSELEDLFEALFAPKLVPEDAAENPEDAKVMASPLDIGIELTP